MVRVIAHNLSHIQRSLLVVEADIGQIASNQPVLVGHHAGDIALSSFNPIRIQPGSVCAQRHRGVRAQSHSNRE